MSNPRKRTRPQKQLPGTSKVTRLQPKAEAEGKDSVGPPSISSSGHLSRSQARALCVANGIAFPVRFEQRPIEADEIPDADIVRVGPNMWLVTLRNKKTGAARKKVKVEYIKTGDRWTCGCKGWINRRDVDCNEIYTIKKRQGLADDPFKLTRRRGRTYYLFPDGTPCEDTRRKRARLEMRTRIPELAEELCAFLGQQPPHKKKGPIEPLPLQMYALLMKVAYNLSLCELASHLRTEPAIWRLGWRKPRGPSPATLGNWFGKLLPFGGLITATAYPGNRLDDTLTGDAFDLPTQLWQNSREMKSGVKKPPYRMDASLVRQHFAKGKVSKLIYAHEATLNRGPGSGEGAHLPSLITSGTSVGSSVRKGIFDRAYGSDRNFRRLDALAVQLYVHTKANEDRLNGKWCQAAETAARMQREHYPEFHEEMRFRPETEEVCSAVRRRSSRIRLRRRKGDTLAPCPVDYDDDEQLSHQSEEVIAAVLDVAQQNVGIARLNESRAIIIVANFVRLIMLEHLYTDLVNFERRRDFNPIPTVREQDLDVVAA